MNDIAQVVKEECRTNQTWLSFYPIVTICGSMRFHTEMLAVAAELTREGIIVIMPHVVKVNGESETHLHNMLDDMHRVKIRMAHAIVVVTDETRYIGKSTRGEIEYAMATGRVVLYHAG